MEQQTYYYAVCWPQGYGMRQTASGRSVENCIPHRFATKAERDAWVADGAQGMRSSNYRESVRRRDIAPAIDSAQRAATDHGSTLWHPDGSLVIA
jgi:hypothetical protein